MWGEEYALNIFPNYQQLCDFLMSCPLESLTFHTWLRSSDPGQSPPVWREDNRSKIRGKWWCNLFHQVARTIPAGYGVDRRALLWSRAVGNSDQDLELAENKWAYFLCFLFVYNSPMERPVLHLQRWPWKLMNLHHFLMLSEVMAGTSIICGKCHWLF